MKKALLLTPIILLILVELAETSGFRIPEIGVAAFGQGNAYVARAEDPSALWFNPAGIVQLQGTQISAHTTFIKPSSNYTTDAGDKLYMEKQNFYVPSLYFTRQIDDRISVGLAVVSPFGLSTDWSKESSLRYINTFSGLTVIEVNPTVAYRISPDLFVGFGIYYLFSKVKLETKLPLGLMNYNLSGNSAHLASPDGSWRVDGTGDAWGFNAGLLFKPTPWLNFGVSYRSCARVNIKGDVRVWDLTGPVAEVFGADAYKTGAESSLTFPDIVIVGVAVKLGDRLIFEADLDWTRASVYDKLEIDYHTNNPVFPDLYERKDWKDRAAFRFGIEYRYSEALKLRAGYVYDQTPVPEHTYKPSIPDADRHDFSVGFGYQKGRYRIDWAWMVILFKSRTVHNTVGEEIGATLNGKYKSMSHNIGVGITYTF